MSCFCAPKLDACSLRHIRFEGFFYTKKVSLSYNLLAAIENLILPALRK